MAYIPEKVEQVIQNGYEFRFGDYLSKGINLVQADIGSFAGYSFVYFLIRIVTQIVPIIGPIAGAIIDPALLIGYSAYAHALDTDQPRDFNTFFSGFQRLGDLFLATFLTGLIIVGVAIPGIILLVYGFSGGFEYLGDLGEVEPNIPAVILGFLLVLAPALYFGVSYALAPMFVWFHGLGGWDAMVASKRLVAKQWWSFLGFFIVCGFLAGAGLLLVCVGMLFTIPASRAAIYAAFADITRLNEEETPNDDLIDHFAPIN